MRFPPLAPLRLSHALLLVLASALLGACGGSPRRGGELPEAGGPDAGPVDAGEVDGDVPPSVDAGGVDGDVPPPIDAGAADGGSPDAGAVDGGGSGGGSIASPPAEITRMGTGGLLLRGVVLTPTGVLDPGEVLVVGNTITCVAADCSATAGAAAATVIETRGIISPGLVDSHNHLAYDFLGEWIPPMPYVDRYTWANDPSYEDFIRPYADMRSAGAVYCPCAKWGELRAIVHGTTTVLGGSAQQGCVNVFVRNPDHYDGIGNEQLATNIADPGDITDAQAATYVSRFTATSPLTRLAVHMAEGTDPMLASEFDSFAGRDPRPNRHNGTSLLSGTGYVGTAVLIHSVPLSMAQLMEAADTQSKMVWSPSSNMVLYGGTADIGAWLALGLTVGLGPDWTLSGEDDMLGELRFARDYARTVGVAAVTSRRLWEMATLDGAEVVGLEPMIGRLEVGARADITVIGRTGGDPYDAVIDADARDVRLTMIDGKAYYGDVALEAATAVNTSCEDFDACGNAKFLCVQNVPATQTGTVNRTTETLDDVRMQLLTILSGYGRSDLLPLASECAP
jgi:cytosine/adenosine deaminase-related metal-dependent hydrolase